MQEAGGGHIYKCHIPPEELLAAQTAPAVVAPAAVSPAGT